MNSIGTQPDITVWGIRVQEPVTMLTDLLISGICFYAFFRISSWKKKEKLFLFFSYYFLSMGMATFLGGIIGHGFLYHFSFVWKLPGWLTSMFSITLIERASIEMCAPVLSQRWSRALRIINIVELIIFSTITFTTLNFFFVEVHSFYGLLIIVASLQFYNYRKTGLQSSKLMLFAVALLMIAAIVFTMKAAISIWFNHLDISHMLMSLAAWLFYISVRQMNERFSGSGAHSAVGR